MRSTFYYENHAENVALQIRTYLNSMPDFLSGRTSSSPRAVGDALQDIVAEKLDLFLDDWSKEYSKNFARRAMADVAYTDREGFYSIIDVKTHREDTKFNMPNLTSVERLSRFYESDENIFALMMIKYGIEENSVKVTNVIFCPIEFLSWECLTIGALGWGQIQIANSNNVVINKGFSRKTWMLSLCDIMLEFYPKEILKISDRVARFEKIRNSWENRDDSW